MIRFLKRPIFMFSSIYLFPTRKMSYHRHSHTDMTQWIVSLKLNVLQYKQLNNLKCASSFSESNKIIMLSSICNCRAPNIRTASPSLQIEQLCLEHAISFWVEYGLILDSGELWRKQATPHIHKGVVVTSSLDIYALSYTVIISIIINYIHHS